MSKQLQNAGIAAADADKQAKDVLAFETRLAKASLSPIEQRDPLNQYHFVKVADADKASPNFPWSEFLKAQGVSVDGFSLSQPKFFAEVSKMVKDAPVEQWQAYFCAHTIDNMAPFLADTFSNEQFDFFGKTLRGQQEQKPRWKRVLGTTENGVGEALGQMYVKQYFPPESKAEMTKLVDNLRVALKARLEKLDWMGADTSAKAIEKWDSFMPKIGYPDKWRSWDGLATTREGYVQNVLRRDQVQLRLADGQGRQAGRSHRMGHDAADGQRLLQPAAERDRVPGRDPAAAVLRSEGGSGAQLRRHRRGHRPRNAARLRRPGRAVRLQGQLRQLVAGGRQERLRVAHGEAGASSSTTTPRSTACTSRAS